jgi:hypothetical protein
MKRLVIGSLILLTINFSCSNDDIDELKICKEFYNLNKYCSFNRFYNISIEPRTWKYDPKQNIYHPIFTSINIYDSILNDYIKLPFIDSNLVNDKSIMITNKCDEKCINYIKSKFVVNNELDLYKALENVSNTVLDDFNNIKIPSDYPNSSLIAVHGKPFIGLIVFQLFKDAFIYYISDSNTFKLEYLPANYKKFDDYWYYKIGN